MQFDTNGWLDVATEIDYSANSMDRQGYDIKYIVLHGTAGGSSAPEIGHYFQSTIGGANPVSSHIIIDQDGNLVQGVPLSLAAFGNGILADGHASYLPDPTINPNLYTASIEFVKSSTDNSDTITPIQAQIGFQVIACICATYNVPRQPGNVHGGIIQHADIDPINRARCPGSFPLADLFTYLQGVIPMNIPPIGWHYDPPTGTLTAPNGHTAHLGNAQFILNAPGGWNPKNVPLEEEHGAPGDGTQQLYTNCLLAWNPKDGVHYGPLGTMYQIAQAQLAVLNTTAIAQSVTQMITALTQLQQHAGQVVSDISSAQTILSQLK